MALTPEQMSRMYVKVVDDAVIAQRLRQLVQQLSGAAQTTAIATLKDDLKGALLTMRNEVKRKSNDERWTPDTDIDAVDLS